MVKRYEKVAGEVSGWIAQGIYTPGSRLPGVRRLSRQFEVSVSTVLQACRLLEDLGRIEAKPRSGYYVRARSNDVGREPAISKPSAAPTLVRNQYLALELVKAANDPRVMQLGAAVPHCAFMPTGAVAQALAAAARTQRLRSADYAFPPGVPELRRQIAQRMADINCPVNPDEIVITNGAQEALTLALRAVTRPGDTVAIESPTFYGLLQVIEAVGLKALEIPTDPRRGVSLDALEEALGRWSIKACVLVPNFSNPLGYCMPEENKRRLLEMLAMRDIPLIEDDVYGDLGYGVRRPAVAKAWDRSGGVLYCSSFSKTLSPGLRVGWLMPGRHLDQVEYQKYVLNLASPTLPQLAVARLLERGGYDRHLRSVRRRYAEAVARMSEAVVRLFPPGTKVTRPEGGFVIWVELSPDVDAMVLQRRALAAGISIAPGPLFSATGRYAHFIRLNCALPWDGRLEGALQTVGKLVSTLVAA